LTTNGFVANVTKLKEEYKMNRFAGFTLIFIIVGLSPLLAYSQPTITIDIPDEVFGLPQFTGKTQTLLISSSEDNTEVVSVDLTLSFVPGEHLVVTGVVGAGDFASGWSFNFGDNDNEAGTEGSGLSIGAFVSGAGVMVGVTPQPLLTITFDSHENATPVIVTIDKDASHGFCEVGLGAGPPVEPTIIPGDKTLPVDLSTFTVIPADRGVILRWRTESEISNFGFNVYRSEGLDGKYVKVNSTAIKGAGTVATPHDYQFVDSKVEVGKTYFYYLEDISFTGEKTRSRIIRVTIDKSGKLHVTGLERPTTFVLLQNYPNPFNPETWIPFRLAKDTDVTIRIYNTVGKLVRTLHLGKMPVGVYHSKTQAAHWDGKDNFGDKVSSGVYFYNLTAGNFSATKKLVILK